MTHLHAFISWQHSDLPLAKELAEALMHCGIPIFIDQNIRIGDLWDVQLEQALNNAFAVIPIWTPASVQSRWVRLESRYALHMGNLCPVLRKACSPPLEFSDVEFADLTDWDSHQTQHLEWDNLISSLRRLQNTSDHTRPGSEADLCFRLGMRFLEGLQVPQNDTIAAQWFRKALHLGDTRASVALAELTQIPRPEHPPHNC